jgi:glycerol-3-phosphate dehydrogenase
LSHVRVWRFCFRDLKIPYFWAGSKAYDLVAGKAGLQSSYFLTRDEALRIFPLLKEPGLSGAMVYYDGKQAAVFFLLYFALEISHVLLCYA